MTEPDRPNEFDAPEPDTPLYVPEPRVTPEEEPLEGPDVPIEPPQVPAEPEPEREPVPA
jgi:hypothetical protein